MSIHIQTFGADPEFFIMDSDGQPVPACSVKGLGVKGSPKLGLLADGCAVEANFAPVSAAHLVVTSGLGVVANFRKLFPKYTTRMVDAMEFDKDVLAKAGPEASASGCVSDVCAWTRSRRPSRGYKDNTRYAGGHLHFGVPSIVGNRDYIVEFVKLLDASFGLSLVEHTELTGRQEWYGKAGIFRPTPYGVEYRTPGTAWLTGNYTNMQLTFENCVHWLQSHDDIMTVLPAKLHEPIQQAINTCDKDLAAALLEELRVVTAKPKSRRVPQPTDEIRIGWATP